MTNVAGKTILHIEDDESIRFTLGYALENKDYIVHTAVNGQEALNFLVVHSKEINLILLDVMMPVMDGFAFYAEKSKIQSYADIPTIMYSADERVRIKAEAIGLPFIRKPFNLADIFEKIEKYVRK